MATSVPAPIAIPRSAWASAGASLTPSPTIATLRPLRCSSATLLALSAGSTSAITVSIPSSRPMRRAVAALSPVSMTTCTPCSRRAAMAGRDVGRGASAMPMSATGRPSTATHTVVRPSAAIAARRLPRVPSETPSRAISRVLPTATRFPSTRAIAPWPGTFSKPCAVRCCTP